MCCKREVCYGEYSNNDRILDYQNGISISYTAYAEWNHDYEEPYTNCETDYADPGYDEINNFEIKDIKFQLFNFEGDDITENYLKKHPEETIEIKAIAEGDAYEVDIENWK